MILLFILETLDLNLAWLTRIRVFLLSVFHFSEKLLFSNVFFSNVLLFKDLTFAGSFVCSLLLFRFFQQGEEKLFSVISLWKSSKF